MAFEEFLQGRRKRLGVAELAADDDAGLELLARHLDELRNAVVVDPRRRKLRAADLQSGYALELLRGGRALLRLGLRRLGRLRLVRLLAAERELPLVEGDPLLLRLLLLFLLRLLRRLLGLRLGGLRLLAERELALVPRRALAGRWLELRV